LYFRLVVYPIHLPPLRERREDILLLVGHFLRRLSADVGRRVERIDPDALDALSKHSWPGNVRELQNVVHRSLLASSGDVIGLADLPPDIRKLALPSIPPATAPAVQQADIFGPDDDVVIPMRELERRAIERALRVTRGSVGKAARLLGIGRATLYRRIATLELSQDVA
jgi:DNA-binding NtrC family response regulator